MRRLDRYALRTAARLVYRHALKFRRPGRVLRAFRELGYRVDPELTGVAAQRAAQAALQRAQRPRAKVRAVPPVRVHVVPAVAPSSASWWSRTKTAVASWWTRLRRAA